MTHSVALPFDHSASGDRCSRSMTLYSGKGGVGLAPSDELCEWLSLYGKSLLTIEEVRRQASDRFYRMASYLDILGLEFSFSSIDEAVLFKLTWG